MNILSLFVFLMFLLPNIMNAISVPTPTEPVWELEKSTEDIKVYTRYILGWSIKEYKAVLNVNAPIKTVEAVLRRSQDQKKWSKNTLMVKEIDRVSTNEFYTYSQSDSPWPASDRDNVVRIIYRYPHSDTIIIDIQACPDKYPKDPNFVRVSRMKGQWMLIRKGSNQTQIIQKAVVDPGGAAPNWLINSFLVNGPLRNLTNLKQYIEQL